MYAWRGIIRQSLPREEGGEVQEVKGIELKWMYVLCHEGAQQKHSEAEGLLQLCQT